jgi:hypothetical protein
MVEFISGVSWLRLIYRIGHGSQYCTHIGMSLRVHGKMCCLAAAAARSTTFRLALKREACQA